MVVLVLGISALAGRPAAATPSSVGNAAVPASPPEGTIPDLAAMGWQTVLNEEFNGTSLNTSLWYPNQNPGFFGRGLWTRDTISVGGGNLALRTYTDASGQHHAGGVISGSLGVENPTWNGFDLTYGYVEARMRFPDGPDTDSTFWMMSNNGNNSLPFGDPGSDGPEIDIVEHGNKPTSGPGSGDANGDGRCDWPASSTVPCSETLLAGGHWDGFEEDHKQMHHDAVQNPNPSVSLQGNFHTYGLLWTPQEYRFFVDGIEVKRVTVGQTYHPEHLIVHTYVDPQSGTDFGPLGDPANDVTLVDYVKVWQRPVSDVPNQSTAATTPLAVPFTVQDYHYSSTSTAEPGVVNVEATSSNPTVVPNSSENLAVTGNGPANPGGSFTNGGFESGSSGWTLTGTGTSVGGGKVHTGSQALHLPETGGRATQTINNLRPNTTYMVGGYYQTDLAFNDANGNGRVDPGESFTDPGDRTARFDWGIQDVDSSRSGNQEVRAGSTRNGWEEDDVVPWWVRDPWSHELLKFTTGPSTTSVTLFLDNMAYVGQQDDSVVHFDSLYMRPMANPQRTLAIRPAEGQVGQTTITLTARNAAGTAMGTDTFTLTVGAGTLRDGSFEATGAATPWTFASGSPRLVVPNPFQADQQVQLASADLDTVLQTVTGLEPNTRYKVDVTGRVSASGGDLVGLVQSYGGAQVSTTITSTTSTTQSFEFVTGASNTTAEVGFVDWVPADGSSFAQGMRLSKCSTTTSCASLTATVPWSPPPDLPAVGAQHGVSGVPLNIGAHLPAGATLSSVTSTNQTLVPNVNIAATGPGRRKAFTVTPIQDRTGETNIRVAYTGAAGSPVDIPVVVSESRFLQPGFEKGNLHWTLSGTATTVTSGQRSGSYALQVNGAGDARQAVVGVPHATGFALGGWVNGSATVTLRTVPIETATEQPETLATATWNGTGWTERTLSFTSLQCTDCIPEHWRPVEVVISDANPGDGQPVRVDDLSLVHRPAIRRQRDISLHSQQTSFGYQTRRGNAVGRVHENALWDPAVRSVTTSDIPGFGTGVVPASNVRGPTMPDHGWPYEWWLDVRAGTRTGRSNVNLTLTDPGTGSQTTETYAVTVNAGDNFNNGDFQRSWLGATNTGWAGAWLNDSHGIVRRQPWQYLGVHDSRWPYVGPRDDGHALRISSGSVQHAITGLAPSTQYTVKLQAKGQGSRVEARVSDAWGASVLGSVVISPPNTDNVWRSYQFTFTTEASGAGSTSVVLYLIDDDTGDGPDPGTEMDPPVPASDRACALIPADNPSTPYVNEAGETCFDDIGLFRTSDL